MQRNSQLQNYAKAARKGKACHQLRDPGELLRRCNSAFTSFSFSTLADNSSSSSGLCTITCPAGPQEQLSRPSSPHQAAGGVGVSGRRAGALKTPGKQHWGSRPSQGAVSASALVTVYITSLPAQPRLLSPAQPLVPSSPWLLSFHG